MNPWKQQLWAGVLIASVVTIPAAWFWHQNIHYRNFREVEPGVLYRSGQLSPYGLARLWHEYGFRTIVSLREDDSISDRGGDPFWEQSWSAAQGIVFVRIPPRSWWTDEPGRRPPPAAAAVREFLQVVYDQEFFPRPILLHCFAGTHRTGIFQAIWRMEVDRWPNDWAIAELRQNGYDSLDVDADVKDFLERYEPTWKLKAKNVGDP